MTADSALLAILQHGDSFFPSGGTAFSWGLEGLWNDKRIGSAADVRAFLEGQLRHRWATGDRLFLVAAHRAHRDLAAVARIDLGLAAMALPRELRDGAQRAGAALLAIHERLATPNVGDYRVLVRSSRAPGHLAAIQGFVWANAGIDENSAAVMSAYALSVGVVGAALRLGAITHIDAQAALTSLRPLTAALLARPVADISEAHVGTPATDIAVMRHETQVTRLFAN